MAPLILTGYIFNTLVYFAIVYYYAPFFGGDFTPHPEFCTKDEDGHDEDDDEDHRQIHCTRRDLFAFQAVSFLNLSYLGLFGTYTFFFSKRCRLSSSSSSSSLAVVPPTPLGRYFGKLSEADRINAVIVIFQGWDFLVSSFFEEHCTMVMMMHHLLAFLCGYFCLVYEVAPYYAGKKSAVD